MTEATEIPEPPPLWGEAVYRRAQPGAPDVHAQLKIDGASVRIEAASLVEKGEVLTGPDGQAWAVAEARHAPGGGYTWAILRPAAEQQQPLNQIAADQPDPPPARGAKGAQDEPDADDDSDDDGSD